MTATVTCARCEGTGVVVLEKGTTPDGCGYARMRPVRGPEDGLKRWHECQTCRGAGILPAWERAEVWGRVAAAGIVLEEALRTEGDLDYDDDGGIADCGDDVATGAPQLHAAAEGAEVPRMGGERGGAAPAAEHE